MNQISWRNCLAIWLFAAYIFGLAQSPRPIQLDSSYEHDKWVTEPKDILREFRAYTTSFDSDDDDDGDGEGDRRAVPEWVAHEIKAVQDPPTSGPDRPSKWFTDDELFGQGIAPNDDSYRGSGYDRGHMCQKLLAFRLGADADWNTHTLLNACPQKASLNRRIWLDLEKLTGEWAQAYGRVWVIAGPVFDDGQVSSWIGDGGEVPVAVPDAFFKIVVRENADNRNRPHVLAFLYPHEPDPPYPTRTPFNHSDRLISVDEIEDATGLDFLTALQDEDEGAVERAPAARLWGEEGAQPLLTQAALPETSESDDEEADMPAAFAYLPIVLYLLGLVFLLALGRVLVKQQRLPPWPYWAASILLLGAAVVAWFFPPPNEMTDAQFSEIAYGIPLLVIFGALGGLLYGFKTKGEIVVPHPKGGDSGGYDPGFLGDIGFGIAGALAVFLIIPANIKLTPLEDLVQAMAIALIGGYGGPALLQQVLSKTVLRKLQEEVEKREEQSEKDAEALELVSAHLDGEEKNEEEIKAAIKEASDAQRVAIFQTAQDVRRKNWKTNKPQMELTIPVFRGLIESKGGRENHRYYAQLGYALKDQASPDWKAARDTLEKAIELREKKGIGGYPYYEFNFALCEITLDLKSKKPLPQDRLNKVWMALRRVKDRTREAIEDHREQIEAWLRRNEFDWENDLMIESPAEEADKNER